VNSPLVLGGVVFGVVGAPPATWLAPVALFSAAVTLPCDAEPGALPPVWPPALWNSLT
jgi:hypothetical protein